MAPRSIAGRAVRDWTLVETVGGGGPIRDLAFELLSRAASRNRELREDHALQTEGLAPRLAIEERFSPQAITSALRQAVSSGRAVKNRQYPRRLHALNGAIGTRFALTNPEVVAEGTGGTRRCRRPPDDRQEGSGTSTTVQGGALGSENGPGWRLGEGVSAGRSLGRSTATATTLSGTVERNAHTPRTWPLDLVHCDLVVRMVSEVKVTGGGPYVAKGERTLPAAAAVWLTQEQLAAAGLRVPGAAGQTSSSGESARLDESKGPESKGEESKGKGKATQEQTEASRSGESSSTTAPAAPALAQELPLALSA